ncbi:unnamed protein product [Prorocentrum cordatum]|uniref:Uncharacterized protein n=1 Tax=Prorocentrum cordatum TaxID=2364126 RepID=A0ABN9QIF7_9DINO|nr:unnamed protein product [Polarella glacialis]
MSSWRRFSSHPGLHGHEARCRRALPGAARRALPGRGHPRRQGAAPARRRPPPVQDWQGAHPGRHRRCPAGAGHQGYPVRGQLRLAQDCGGLRSQNRAYWPRWRGGHGGDFLRRRAFAFLCTSDSRQGASGTPPARDRPIRNVVRQGRRSFHFALHAADVGSISIPSTF